MGLVSRMARAAGCDSLEKLARSLRLVRCAGEMRSRRRLCAAAGRVPTPHARRRRRDAAAPARAARGARRVRRQRARSRRSTRARPKSRAAAAARSARPSSRPRLRALGARRGRQGRGARRGGGRGAGGRRRRGGGRRRRARRSRRGRGGRGPRRAAAAAAAAAALTLHAARSTPARRTAAELQLKAFATFVFMGLVCAVLLVDFGARAAPGRWARRAARAVSALAADACRSDRRLRVGRRRSQRRRPAATAADPARGHSCFFARSENACALSLGSAGSAPAFHRAPPSHQVAFACAAPPRPPPRPAIRERAPCDRGAPMLNGPLVECLSVFIYSSVFSIARAPAASTIRGGPARRPRARARAREAPSARRSAAQDVGTWSARDRRARRLPRRGGRAARSAAARPAACGRSGGEAGGGARGDRRAASVRRGARRGRRPRATQRCCRDRAHSTGSRCGRSASFGSTRRRRERRAAAVRDKHGARGRLRRRRPARRRAARQRAHAAREIAADGGGRRARPRGLRRDQRDAGRRRGTRARERRRRAARGRRGRRRSAHATPPASRLETASAPSPEPLSSRPLRCVRLEMVAFGAREGDDDVAALATAKTADARRGRPARVPQRGLRRRRARVRRGVKGDLAARAAGLWREPAAARARAARALPTRCRASSAPRCATRARRARQSLSAEASCTDRLLAQFVEQRATELLASARGEGGEPFEARRRLSRCGQVADGGARAPASASAVVALALAGGGACERRRRGRAVRRRCGAARARVADCAQLTDAAFERAGPLRRAKARGAARRDGPRRRRRGRAQPRCASPLRRLPKRRPDRRDRRRRGRAPRRFRRRRKTPTSTSALRVHRGRPTRPRSRRPRPRCGPPPPPLELVRLGSAAATRRRAPARARGRAHAEHAAACARARRRTTSAGCRACPRLASLGLDRCALEDPALADADDDGGGGWPAGVRRRLTLAETSRARRAAAGRWTALELPPACASPTVRATLLSGARTSDALSLREGHGCSRLRQARAARPSGQAAGGSARSTCASVPSRATSPCAVFAAARLGAFHAVGCDKLTDRGVAELRAAASSGASTSCGATTTTNSGRARRSEEYRPPPPRDELRAATPTSCAPIGRRPRAPGRRRETRPSLRSENVPSL